jgi:hypothetical protein
VAEVGGEVCGFGREVGQGCPGIDGGRKSEEGGESDCGDGC